MGFHEWSVLVGPVVSGTTWMNDYEKYSEDGETSFVEDWKMGYGRAEPSIPVSSVPCGGCGALLHCQVFLSYQMYSFLKLYENVTE